MAYLRHEKTDTASNSLNMNPKICIIILNWNQKQLLENCLSSLLYKTDYPNYNVLVVDNGSTDGSRESIEKKFPQVEILTLDKNYGFAKANNIGITHVMQKLKPDYIVLLNNDTEIVEHDWLSTMVKAGYDITQPVILNRDGTIQSKGGGVSILGAPYLIKDDEKPVWVSFACSMIKRTVFEKIGLLNEEYVIYAEDLDFCLRANANNCKIGVSRTRIIHHGSQTAKELGVRYYYYKSRNDYWTITKYYRFRLMRVGYLLHCIIESLVLLLGKNVGGSKGIIRGVFHALLEPKANIYNLVIMDTSISKLLTLIKKRIESYLLC